MRQPSLNPTPAPTPWVWRAEIIGGQARDCWGFWPTTKVLATFDALGAGCAQGYALAGTIIQNGQEPFPFAADHLWSDPWRAAIQASIRRGRVFGTPIAEHAPVRLAQEGVALVGDAAHVSTPMVGTGFGYGLDDVDSLACLVGRHPGDLDSALVCYQRERLHHDRALAQEGMDASRYFLAHIRDQPAVRRPQSACLTA